MTPFQVARMPGGLRTPPGTAGSPPSPDLGRGAGVRIVNFCENEDRALSVSLPELLLAL
jgi:hypothetical protein